MGDPIKPKPFRVEGRLVRPDLNRIEGEGDALQVEPRVMDLLVLLARRAGEVISREELLDQVWSDRVVNEESLTRAVFEIRNLFGDDPRNPRVVETIRKGGYRLIAAVSWPEETPSDAAHGMPPAPSPSRLKGILRFVLVAAAVVAAAALLLRLRTSPPQELPSIATLHDVPFTSYPGIESAPAFSPDGGRIAFSWNGGGGDGTSFDIYIKLRNTETPLRLTDHPARESFPAWSPDGSEIAFFRGGDEKGIYLVPSIGGPARLLVATRVNVNGLDWSPDGGRIAYAGAVADDLPPQIDMISLDNRECWPVTRPTPHSSCDYMPRFSDDGKTIAFIRSGPVFQQEIYLVLAAGGEARRLTFARGIVMGMDWVPGGNEIVFSSAPSVDFSLWRVSTANGSLFRLPTRGKQTVQPALSPTGGALVYEERSRTIDIGRVRLGEEAGPSVEEEPFLSSTRADYSARYSPDGESIVFLSTRSGDREVWVADGDGGNARRLTSLGGPYVSMPVWSADGKRIAFSTLLGECSVVCLVDAAGGPMEVLTAEVCHEIASLWSNDGEWLYFERGSGSGWGVWKRKPGGGGESLITPHAGTALLETDKGDLIYFRIDESGLWKVPAAGGDEICLAAPEAMTYWNGWTVTGEGAYFTRFYPGGDLLGYLDFSTGEARRVAQLPASGVGGLALSPDGAFLLYDRTGPEESDLILVDDFR